MTKHTPHILVVEDDLQQREVIAHILTSEGFEVIAADSVEQAIVELKSQPIDLVFSDWKLGSLSGIDLLRYVKKQSPHIGFAMATAYGTIEHAVKAIEAGADDYLSKPFSRQALLLCIDKIDRARQLREQNRQLQGALGEQQQLVDLIGQAPCMQTLFTRLEKMSATDATVLILGESGTGKELAARALHKLSPRAEQPFIAINCGAIPATLAEAELFGAMKGAYTGADRDKQGKFQAASGGSLFLDEVGELPLELQTRLLRFLQEGTVTPLGSHQEVSVDVRVLAATHRNLEEMVTNGQFREDLYYRLNILPVTMPPLRERREDIPLLAKFFIQKSSNRYHRDPPAISKAGLKQLMEHSWPGNVRELANRIERFVLLEDETELVSQRSDNQSSSFSGFTFPAQGLDFDQLEKYLLTEALARSQGNRTAAAKLLNMNYKAFLYRLEKFGIC
ncbi:sigma-54-dependent transcriptional regulator [Aestuariibacter salexigens]|uniref:sigma-54-dependent transcriptional regulator n=1 Tax=Aestuariibacter salexigens TaxID=226010 RepID=UPI0003FEE806|nr:sigma-54 dependent transcriptional regulator [Aestuariibacter salexigens]